MNQLRVVLVSPRNPLNIGAAARAMSNFGVSEMRLVNPYEVAFREAKSAVNAQSVLDEARELFAAKLPAIQEARASVGGLFPAYQHIVRRAAATDVGFNRWVAP